MAIKSTDSGGPLQPASCCAAHLSPPAPAPAAVTSPGPAAAAVVAAVERGAAEAANTGTVGLYYVREHVRQSLPAVLQACHALQATAAAAEGATYAAGHSREFATMLRRELPASLHRMEAALRDASWAAADAVRRHQELQRRSGTSGGGTSGSTLGSLLGVPPRLRELWAGSGAGGAGGSSGCAGEPRGSDIMYHPDI